MGNAFPKTKEGFKMIKNKITVLGISLLAGLLITGSVTGALALKGPSTAYAAPQSTATPADTTEVDQQDSNDAIEAPETADAPEDAVTEKGGDPQDSATEAAEDAVLASNAVITAAQAEEAVYAAYPGCTITGTKLGDENGVVIYEVSITDTSGTALDVKVDAADAKVLSADSGADDEQETAGHDTDTDNVEQEGEH
jgi:uncharacterized membrane protein YkoI